eukprot:scaffold44043_cov36-Phaeocystis_antarctica.AAC.1
MNPTLTSYNLTASHALKPTLIISPTSSHVNPPRRHPHPAPHTTTLRHQTPPHISPGETGDAQVKQSGGRQRRGRPREGASASRTTSRCSGRQRRMGASRAALTRVAACSLTQAPRRRRKSLPNLTKDGGTRGSGTGPALTGVIDQGRGSKVGCWCEAVTK